MIVREKFGLVRGQINAHRAVALAALAGEAEVERLFHVLVAPAVADHVALGHLPEQVGAAAGGVLLFVRHPPARAHDAAFLAAAFSDADAAQHGVGQAAVVVGKLEVGLGVPGLVVGAQAQILIQR